MRGLGLKSLGLKLGDLGGGVRSTQTENQDERNFREPTCQTSQPRGLGFRVEGVGFWVGLLIVMGTFSVHNRGDYGRWESPANEKL